MTDVADFRSPLFEVLKELDDCFGHQAVHDWLYHFDIGGGREPGRIIDTPEGVDEVVADARRWLSEPWSTRPATLNMDLPWHRR